jgi:hypothetical protein
MPALLRLLAYVGAVTCALAAHSDVGEVSVVPWGTNSVRCTHHCLMEEGMWEVIFIHIATTTIEFTLTATAARGHSGQLTMTTRHAIRSVATLSLLQLLYAPTRV